MFKICGALDSSGATQDRAVGTMEDRDRMAELAENAVRKGSEGSPSFQPSCWFDVSFCVCLEGVQRVCDSCLPSTGTTVQGCSGSLA